MKITVVNGTEKHGVTYRLKVRITSIGRITGGLITSDRGNRI